MNIVIIGGGITGLTTALALKKLNINCAVFEKSDAISKAGSGIGIQSNAIKVFDWLGIGEKVRNAGVLLEQAEITNPDLVSLRKPNLILSGDTQHNFVSIHRAALHNVLFESLPPGIVEFGQEYKEHRFENGKVRIQLKDKIVESDILLGADGINSRVRKQMFPDAALRYSGQTSWRGIAKFGLPPQEHYTVKEAWGKGVRFGFSPISSQETYWFAVANSPERQSDRPDSLKEDLLRRYEYFAPLVSELIRNTAVERIIRTDINDLKRLPKWFNGRVCLIGDAAHATTPNLGQGAGQGVEDAFYLSKILSRESDPEKAFETFEKSRRKKVDYIVDTSWKMGKMAHHSLGQKLLKFAIKYTPEPLFIRQMKKITDINSL
jgi:2-polyprenyl-6-methoxyphenol hydroxylase-like FAD-dependent oxidoreductase